MENQVKEREALIVADELQTVTDVATKKEDIVPLNCDVALSHYSPEEKAEIIQLSESIDVRKIDQVMSYCAEVSKNEPIHLEKKYVKCFNVKFGNKFVLVVKSSDGNVDDIYCNNEKLCSIKYTSLKTKYGIYYDSISKLWLVVNGEGKGIYITPDGKYKDIDLSKYVNNTNVSNIYFEKELIYIPSDECLYIIKANDQSNIKKLECPNIMDYDSRLFDNNAKVPKGTGLFGNFCFLP